MVLLLAFGACIGRLLAEAPRVCRDSLADYKAALVYYCGLPALAR